MRSVPAAVAAAVGAAIAVISLLGPGTFSIVDIASSRSRWGELFESRPVAAVVGALVAVIAAVVVRHTVAAILGAAIGVVALIVLALTEIPGQSAGYPSAIAAGLVLGCLAVATRPGATSAGGRAGWVGLAVGVAAGFLLARSDPFTHLYDFSENRAYADYLPGALGATHSEANPLVLFGAVVALMALAVFAFQVRRAPSELVERPGRTVIIVGVGVPVATFLVYAWMRGSTSTFGQIDFPGWVFTAVLVAVALAAALVLPSRTGLVWVGVVALVAAATALGDVGGGWFGAVVIVAFVVLGAVGARKRAGPPIGLAVLVVAVLLQLAEGNTSELIAIVGALFVLPAALGYTMAACTSEPRDHTPLVHPAVVAAALSTAVPLSTPGAGVDFGWTAYTPLTDSLSGAGYLDIGSTTDATVTVSALSLVAAGVVAWIIDRRVPTQGENHNP